MKRVLRSVLYGVLFYLAIGAVISLTAMFMGYCYDGDKCQIISLEWFLRATVAWPLLLPIFVIMAIS